MLCNVIYTNVFGTLFSLQVSENITITQKNTTKMPFIWSPPSCFSLWAVFSSCSFEKCWIYSHEKHGCFYLWAVIEIGFFQNLFSKIFRFLIFTIFSIVWSITFRYFTHISLGIRTHVLQSVSKCNNYWGLQSESKPG